MRTKESIRTIISDKFISVLVCTGGDYTCCVVPRYDAYLFSQAIKEAVRSNGSISFETPLMSIDILNMKNTFIIDFTNKKSAHGFQITCSSGQEIGETLERAAMQGLKSFGKPIEEGYNWVHTKVLQKSK